MNSKLPREYHQDRRKLRRNRPEHDDEPDLEFLVESEPSDWTAARALRFAALMWGVSILAFVLFRAAADPLKEFVVLAMTTFSLATLLPPKEAFWLLVSLSTALFCGEQYAAYLLPPVCLSILANNFARHNIYWSTASPVPLEMRDQLRREFESAYGRHIIIPLTAVLSAIFMTQASGLVLWLVQLVYFMAGWLLILCAAIAFCVCGNTVASLLDTSRSWWTHNLRNLTLCNVFRSPAGSCAQRIAQTYLTVIVASAPLASPCALFAKEVLDKQPQAELLDAAPANELAPIDLFGATALHWSSAEIFWLVLPALVTYAAMILGVATTLPKTSRIRKSFGTANTFEAVMERLRSTGGAWLLVIACCGLFSLHQPLIAKETEVFRRGFGQRVSGQRSELPPSKQICFGTDANLGEPVVCGIDDCNHIYINGGTGSGKTIQLLQLLRQIASVANHRLAAGARGGSLVVLDLKADDHLTFHILRDTAARLGIPFKYVTNLTDTLSTYSYNPFDSPHIVKKDPQAMSEFICGATGLLTGREYGKGHFSSVSAKLIQYGCLKYPQVRSFRELSNLLINVLHGPERLYKHELNPEFIRSGTHAMSVVERLGRLDQFNVTARGNHPRMLWANSVCLQDVVETPQIVLFHLNSTEELYSAAEIGLVVAFDLISAATNVPHDRRVPVFLAIDEFSKLAHSNFVHILEQSRSILGGGTILANQSLASLREVNLLDSVLTNDRVRIWMGLTHPDEQLWFSQRAGERSLVREELTVHESRYESISYRHEILPLYPINLLKMIANDEELTILELTRRGRGVDYGGFPVTVRRLMLRDPEQWARLAATPWPKHDTGTFVPRTRRPEGDPAFIALAGELEPIDYPRGQRPGSAED